MDDQEQLYSTEAAAAELGVPENTISKWKHRGRVEPRDYIAGRGRGGVVPLFSLEDLRPLAEAYHLRQTATRQAR